MKKVKLSTLGSLIDRNFEQPAQVLNLIISTQGWYRIASADLHGGVGIMSISSIYQTIPASSLMFLFGISYGVPLYVNKLTTGISVFTKARILAKPGNDCFLEVYYSPNSTNGCSFALSSSTRVTLLTTLTQGGIDAGYTATEYNL